MQSLSIVIPCYNEEEVILETISRLKKFSNEVVAHELELIFVDDGSSDTTRELLKQELARGASFKLIGLARNFGHQVAATAGIHASEGDAVVLIDADLQDPRSVIHEMI